MKGEANSTEYDIQLTPLALEMLAEVKDRREQQKLRDRIDQLKIEPEKQGKALVDNLSGFRSIRAVGQRYRIVYKVEQERVMVVVVGLGRRKDGDKKDIYSILQKLLDI
ncbi:MAG: type II toxin-antitoxin system RelE/ParE family toxin [Microcoleus sp. PH2017_10_PVI_O_A]|uniref:type II toxin-antitoxin system RelE family toxin n=1 Tax=unclassified Microcoleus TaxID=2642155 RepID=UPI001E1889D6|nr:MULTISPECIES: type II toxin-antitoxin system RelE/ParE family toxin [unclassified Microcoleus]TAE84052.1 MAG: type II toxin-antitoxin system RelE/ParE family toxin [Oscillatoriales cyanobacterium]MCC3405630.1 type II toxin-antitoxin system RelE/ParE family toxin [Microcoleus sp. PH2017_10_PVI_O_A]MCC3459603.1 type II toxin-antitoxin system RelE/ParE family toxin [Microcoleus sp. PH2017_11_PCY_U_A]MCC3478095.1 type II toxin-antitoxin system RelE/ParE family toxin [Microcoleus sp. PH2017_12_PC